MPKINKTQPYDLEERTFKFTKEVVTFIKSIPKNLANNAIAKQLIRSSGSVGANYIEANESLSKKDFVMRAKICRKEAKESIYWLRLIEISGAKTENQREGLIDEATQLLKIFSAIIEKSK